MIADANLIKIDRREAVPSPDLPARPHLRINSEPGQRHGQDCHARHQPVGLVKQKRQPHTIRVGRTFCYALVEVVDETSSVADRLVRDLRDWALRERSV